MKNLLNLALLLFAFTAFAQQRLEITKAEGGKVKYLTENQRVKVRTTDGKKHVGALHFKDVQTLEIDGENIPLDSLKTIKSQPKVLGTVKTVVLVAGVALIGSSVVVAAGGGDAAILLFTSGAGLAVVAGVIDAVDPTYNNRKWKYKVVAQP